MSVWESTTYKLDVAKTIYRYLPKEIDRVLGATIGSYLSPRGPLVGFSDSDSWDEIASILGWESEVLDDDTVASLQRLSRGVKKWLVGMHGVYSLIDAVHKDKFEVKDQYPYTAIERRMAAVGSVLSASTMTTLAPFMAKWNQVDKRLQPIAQKFENMGEAWKFYARNINIKSTEYAEIDQDRFFGSGDRFYYGGSVGNMVILRGSDLYSERGIILTRAHVDMLVGSCLRLGNLVDYISREYCDDRDMKARMMRMVNMTISTAFKCGRSNIDKVVQAFHKARAYMQMQMFSNIMDDAMTEALLEFQKKNLQTIVDLPAYMRCFKGLAKGRWLDIIHVYKWMPPPDYDATYAFTELQEFHMNPRPSALDPGSSQEMKDIWRLIVRERKLNIATAFLKLNRKWPDSLRVSEGDPSPEELDAWAPYGLFPYFQYGKDVTAQIKDKATVLPRIQDEICADGRRYERNFLLWFLINKPTIDTRVIAEQISNGSLPEENYVRVAYKGEAHKPGSRLFFMAPPLQRLALGEMEGNISRIACEYPSSLQGIDALTRSARLSKLFSLEDTNFSVEPGEQFTGYIVTFDLSKFSPKFNPAVLVDLHEFWADIFAYEPIRYYRELGANSVILHTTNNLVLQYKNKGADLEGFRGRMMTLFHADLISTACRYAKDLGYILGKSHSAVFIDDGAVKIAAAGVGEMARSNALHFLECMQKVYAAAGQENHPNKTIVSGIGGELLAEQYIFGQRIKCPVKAAMRLFPPYEMPATAITEEFDALFSTAQGSVKDGGDWVIAYRRLADSYTKSIYRWARNDFKYHSDVRFAFRFVTPKSFGGFGFPTLQALTSTAAYDMTSEGLGILNSAARMYESYRSDVTLIIHRRVVNRTNLQRLRDPMRIRMVGPIIVEGRLASALVRKLSGRSGPWSNFLGLVTDKDVTTHAEAIAASLLSQDTISIPVLQRAWECTPLAYLEGLVQKFKRSASIMMILSEKEIQGIRRANMKDVSVLLRTYF